MNRFFYDITNDYGIVGQLDVKGFKSFNNKSKSN